MDSRPLARDDRAFTETFAVAALVAITLTMTLTVGIYVLAVGPGEEAPTTTFEYDYDGSSDSLLIRYVEGEEYAADEIHIETEEKSVTWSRLAGTGPNGTLVPGDALQLSRRGSWGRPVTGATELRILHGHGENATQLSNWTA